MASSSSDILKYNTMSILIEATIFEGRGQIRLRDDIDCMSVWRYFGNSLRLGQHHQYLRKQGPKMPIFEPLTSQNVFMDALRRMFW